METYDSQTLDNHLTIMLNDLQTYERDYADFFQLMFENGLRFNEMKNTLNWSNPVTGVVRVPLSKNQTYREFGWPQEIIDFWFTRFQQQNYFGFVNSSTADMLIKKYMPSIVSLDSGKSISTHLFRHAWVKRMDFYGIPPAAIGSIMGEININNVNGYINSIINYTMK